MPPSPLLQQKHGYHVRSRIEAKMRCLKAFGERIAARDPDRQTAEIQIRIALMNVCAVSDPLILPLLRARLLVRLCGVSSSGSPGRGHFEGMRRCV